MIIEKYLYFSFFHIIKLGGVSINIYDLSKLNFKNTIDIRKYSDYNEGSIPNSINISRENLLLNPEKFLEKNKTYYIYCEYGEKSKKLSKELNEAGYNTISIDGGYNSYKKFINR